MPEIFIPRASFVYKYKELQLYYLTPLEQAIGKEAGEYSSIASLAFLVWDILITYDDEIDYIWPKPWTLTKYLYFYARYFPLMVQISILCIGTDVTPAMHFTSHDCFIWQVYQVIAVSTIVAVVDIILILRVIALFHGNPVMRTTLTFLYIVELVGMTIGLALAVPDIQYNEICLVIDTPRTLFIYGAATLSFQVILFALTSWKFLDAVRSGWGDVPLILLLMRDGTWAFVLLMAVYIGQGSIYGLKNSAFSGLLYGWLLTAYSFSGYRILLNINHLSPSERHSHDMHRTNTNIQFTTQIISDVASNSPSESFELSRRSSLITTGMQEIIQEHVR